jgi:hypothetical protein
MEGFLPWPLLWSQNRGNWMLRQIISDRRMPYLVVHEPKNIERAEELCFISVLLILYLTSLGLQWQQASHNTIAQMNKVWNDTKSTNSKFRRHLEKCQCVLGVYISYPWDILHHLHLICLSCSRASPGVFLKYFSHPSFCYLLVFQLKDSKTTHKTKTGIAAK